MGVIPAPLKLVIQIAERSSDFEGALEFIRGGPLTDALEGMGAVHLAVAAGYLRELPKTRNPDKNLHEAEHSLRVAHEAYKRASMQGIRVLRLRTDGRPLMMDQQNACLAASTVALIQWVLGENPEIRVEWVHNAGARLGEYCKSRRDLHVQGRTGFGLASYRMGMESFGSQVMTWELHPVMTAYYELERNLLPSSFVEEPPRLYQPVEPGTLVSESFRGMYREDESWLPRTPRADQSQP